MRHLDYWKTRMGNFALVHLTPERIGKERQILADAPTNKGTRRSPATVNRYVSSLSAVFSHALRLRWINENPCFNLTKLKENSGRDRVLTEDEITRLRQQAGANAVHLLNSGVDPKVVGQFLMGSTQAVPVAFALQHGCLADVHARRGRHGARHHQGRTLRPACF